MDSYIGLVKKFPVDVPLDEGLRARQFKQKQRMLVKESDQSDIIRFNSTYLEMVDSWFADKGSLTWIGIIALCFAFGFLVLTGMFAMPRDVDPPGRIPLDALPFMAALLVFLVLPFGLGGCYLIRKDAFGYTHYPTRFNRKTGMVYVFRPDGSVLTAPWYDIVFIPVRLPSNECYQVRGHLLDADNVTIRATFSMSCIGHMLNPKLEREPYYAAMRGPVCAQWEFVRRYMEEGADVVHTQVPDCVPSDIRYRDTIGDASRAFELIAGAPFIWYCLAFPFCLLFSLLTTLGAPMRYFALRHSRLPVWPDEVEAACAIEPDDPYAFQGNAEGERVALFEHAARAAGVVFRERQTEQWEMPAPAPVVSPDPDSRPPKVPQRVKRRHRKHNGKRQARPLGKK